MQEYTPPRKTFWFFDNKLVLIGLGAVVLAGLLFTVFYITNNDVKIVDEGQKHSVSVFGGTVSEALVKAGLELNDKDVVQPDLNTRLEDGMKINITRAIDVQILVDGQKTNVVTPKRVIKELLEEQKIALGPDDRVEPGLKQRVSTGDTIKITRVTYETVTENRTVPFITERKNDDKLFKGITRVMQQGKNGVAQLTIKVTMEDGKEVKREIVGEKTIQNPVSRIVAMGTIREKNVSRGGTIRFSRVINMNASGYTYTGNNTASGVPPRPGVVAVDPKVIPLGSKLYVDGYGYCTALDVGSSIKGEKIDLFFETKEQALKWGRRNTKVYVLE